MVNFTKSCRNVGSLMMDEVLQYEMTICPYFVFWVECFGACFQNIPKPGCVFVFCIFPVSNVFDLIILHTG